MQTQYKTFGRCIRNYALAGLAALTLAGCSKEHTRGELADARSYTNSLDQVFANSQQEVWAFSSSNDGRVTQRILGVLITDYPGRVFVRVYKDLPENSKPYEVEYEKDGEVIEREVHMQKDANIQPTSEMRRSGKTTYEVNNWEMTK
ncbi:Uncharacterised protein [uncultured archaeon]|nr:Uncharacterised protein [uncultured archaeon]